MVSQIEAVHAEKSLQNAFNCYIITFNAEIIPLKGGFFMSKQKEPIPQPEAAGPSPASKAKEDEGFASDLFAWLQALSFALVVLMIVFTFFGRIIGVDGSSMLPTLTNGDLLFLRCAGYEPEQGDVVVLHKSFSVTSEPIVKRVIAVGGQSVHIDYDSSTVYVDGQALEEPYLGEPMLQPGSASMQTTDWDVPEGSVFVMGDNRNNSADSRVDSLGPVANEYVLGKALVVLFPFSHIGSIH